jgi:hypothetical protein
MHKGQEALFTSTNQQLPSTTSSGCCSDTCGESATCYSNHRATPRMAPAQMDSLQSLQVVTLQVQSLLSGLHKYQAQMTASGKLAVRWLARSMSGS